MSPHIRPATSGDVEAVARIVNAAYEVERFFVRGDRTSPADVRAHMATGTILVADEEGVVGCVYVETEGTRGSFGMLAVDPARQRTGVGRRLIEAAEQHIREAGGRFVEIFVVNLRDDLLPRYRAMGFADTGTAPYVHRPTVQPVHFIVMRKAL
jgi:N-acetylglutamate synthase-like GNAT family acetyltransferase